MDNRKKSKMKMKFKKHNFYMGFMFFFITSCYEDHNIHLNVFFPSIEVTPKILSREKFERVPDVDVTIYSFKNLDTIILFSFDFEQKRVLSQSWVINLSNSDSITLSNFFIKNHLQRSAFYQFYENISKENRRSYIHHSDYNQLYEITLDSNNNNLWITYFNPIF